MTSGGLKAASRWAKVVAGDGSVWVGTQAGRVWRSGDGGQTWADVTSGYGGRPVTGDLVEGPDGRVLDRG